jgi:hypothetical protein
VNILARELLLLNCDDISSAVTEIMVARLGQQLPISDEEVARLREVQEADDRFHRRYPDELPVAHPLSVD